VILLDLQSCINLVIRLMNVHFVLYGYSVSVMEIMVYFFVAGVLGLIIGALLK